jgi:hypothetical protein
VATEIVVDPTRAGTNWRAPKWLAEKTANDRACDSSNRTRDQQTGACSRSGANHVSAGRWRNRRDVMIITTASISWRICFLSAHQPSRLINPTARNYIFELVTVRLAE